MSNEQLLLIEKAIEKYGKNIKKLPTKPFLSDCFATYKNVLYFYFNDAENSTHVVKEGD